MAVHHRVGPCAANVRVRRAARLAPASPYAALPALDVRDVTRIVTGYAELAGLPEARRSPHVLRHTFCTHLANAHVPIDVIRELAGHADIRTTTIYTAVNDDRLKDAITEAARRRRGLGRLAA